MADWFGSDKPIVVEMPAFPSVVPRVTTTVVVAIPVSFALLPDAVIEDPPPSIPECRHIAALPGDKYLDKVKDLCWGIAPAFLSRGGDFKDVLHAMYVVACESGGDPLANRRNWGDIGIVPEGYWSHMSHLWPERSMRLLDYLIDPMDLEESSELAAALVFTSGEGGWYNWWSCHWALNPYLADHGIPGVYYNPPDAYWQNVRGGQQIPPWKQE